MKSMTGEDLKVLRGKLTQQELAQKLFCSISTLQKWEQGINPINELTATAIRSTLK